MKRPTPRLFRRLLKPAIAVVLLIVAPSAYVLWTRATFEDQYKAVEEIEELGGSATLQPRTADPMCWFVRAEVYCDVWNLDFLDREVTPEIMDRICRIHTLQDLDISGSAVAEGQFAKLGKLQHIRSLDLSGTNVSDEDLAHLSRLRSVRVLKLLETAISDKGLQYVAQMTGLKQLTLYDTRVTDSGLPTLGKLAQLRDLSLSDTSAPAPGRDALQKTLPNLRINF